MISKKEKERINCWQFMKCGREPGGMNTRAGVCPTADAVSMNGINGGINGGRVCWLVSGTYGKQRAEYANCIAASRVRSCMHCDFHNIVLAAEGFKITDKLISDKIKKGLASVRYSAS